MTRQRHKISVAAGAVLTLVFTGFGQAEPAIETFDCPEIIENMIDASEPLQWQAQVPFLIAHADTVELPNGNNIMTADERTADIVRADVFEAANGDGVVGCVLIAVRFHDPGSAGGEGRTVSSARDTQPSRIGREFLPILLMRRFDTDSEHTAALNSWRDDRFNIELVAGDDPDTEEIEPDELDVTIRGAPVPFGAYLVNNIRYLDQNLRPGRTRPRADQFMVQMLPSDLPSFLADQLGVPEGRYVAEMAVVICGPGPCNDLLPESGAAYSLPQNGRIEIVPFEESAQPAEPPMREPAPVNGQITFTINEQQGELDSARIACLLDALGAEVRLDPAHQCETRILDVGANSTLVIDGPTNWRLEQRRPPEPRQIAVTLPNTVEARTCAMDVTIFDGAGVVMGEVALNPPADGTARGATFTGIWPDNFLSSMMGEVTLSLRPFNEAGCGGPARELTVPLAEVISVSLLLEGTVESALEIAHISAFQSADLMVDFALDTALQDLLADQILAASSMAHVHLDQSIGAAPSPISAAVFGRIGADGRPTTTAFTAAELAPLSGLAQIVYEGFERVGFIHSAPNQRGDIERSIAQLAREAEARGATALHVNLFGPVLSRATVDRNAVCEDLRLDQELLLRDLPIPTSVAAYPLLAMEANEAYNLSALAPLALPSGAERLPSGLMRCLNTGSDVMILPYFNEAWRSPRDLPARYATAIGDHLATTLIAKVAELEDRP